MVDIGGNAQQDGSRSCSHEIGEIGDIKAPGNLVIHVRGEEAEFVLLQVVDEANEDDGQEQKAPRIISLASLGHQVQGLHVKMPGLFQGLSELFHILGSNPRKSSKTSIRYSNLP